MNESEAPILLIRGTISIESMKENLRNRAAETGPGSGSEM